MKNQHPWLHRFGLDNRRMFRDELVIILGAFIMALGIAVFLIDAKVVPGGVSGLAMAVSYLSEGRIPVGLTMWIFNIPLYIWGVRELGKQFGARTFIGFTALSFFIDLLRGRVPGLGFIRLHEHPSILKLQQTDFLLMVLVGGTLLGVGLGIIFKFRGSTAGSDILAAVAQKRWGTKPGHTFMIADFCVISAAAAVIALTHTATDRSVLSLTLYALFLLFVSSRIVDVIIDGFDYARSAFVISTKAEKIASVIMKEMGRGVTAIEAKGLYTKEKREILFTVLTRKEIGTLVEEVKRIDPKAFVIVNNVHEVLGEGFRPRF